MGKTPSAISTGCCGDWRRIVTHGALSCARGPGSHGIFLDPPYLGEVRCKDLYATDDHDIAREVAEWAIENGDNPSLRIVLAGYEGEHDMPASWRVVKWKAKRPYGTANTAANEHNHNRNP